MILASVDIVFIASEKHFTARCIALNKKATQKKYHCS